MPQSTIQMCALGPASKPYQTLANDLEPKYKRRGAKLNAPTIPSDSNWSSVMLSVGDDVGLRVLNNFFDALMELQDNEQKHKTDISVQVEETHHFFDLPAQRDQFFEEYALHTSKK